MAGVCDRFWAYVEAPGRDAEERELRRLLFTVGAGLTVAQTAATLGSLDAPTLWLIGMGSTMIGSGIGWAFPLSRSRANLTSVMNVIALFSVIGILLMDLVGAAVTGNRVWSLVVMIMDILLVFKCPLEAQLCTMVMTILTLAVLAAEESAGFGLYKGFLLGEDRPMPAVCDCSSPPCSIPLVSSSKSWFLIVVVLVADYVVTRGFSTKLRMQLEQNRCSVQVTEHITALLATYATDAARRLVAEEGFSLPQRLRDSYEQLLSNLDSYRVYLPDSVLLPAEDRIDDAAADAARHGSLEENVLLLKPPGLGEEEPRVAICFTDIQSSTELWESYPQGMYDALNIHNRALRDVYNAHSGYEVKTIGDSFMIAFADALSALGFGLQAQVALLRQPWPEDLLNHPLCCKILGSKGELLWCGLRVRIGVQCGPVRIECNPVTDRCDYFGHVVNTAARMEAVLRKGGLVATTAAVLDEIGNEGRNDLGSPVVHDAGLRELKGVREKVQVYALCPQDLSGRLSILSESVSPAMIPTSPGMKSHSLGAGAVLIARSIQGGSISSGSRSSASSQSMVGVVQPVSRAISRTKALQLKRASATCAAVRASLRRTAPVSDRLPRFVAAVCLAADMSTGVVDSVLSASVIVTWNTSRICAEHAAACRKFIIAPFRAPCHLGVASGAVLTGCIAAGRRRFATVIGACVELAAALAEEADCCQDHVLATGHVAQECAAAGHAFRAQLWRPIGAAHSPSMEVWEIDPELEQSDDKWMYGTEGSNAAELTTETWCDGIAGVFRVACAAEPGEELSSTLAAVQALGHNEAARRLARRIEAGTVRTRLMAPLWAPDQDEHANPTVPSPGQLDLPDQSSRDRASQISATLAQSFTLS